MALRLQVLMDATQGLILELMNSDQFSCQTIGLQALRNLVLSAPAYGLSESLADPAFQTSPSQQVCSGAGLLPWDSDGSCTFVLQIRAG